MRIAVPGDRTAFSGELEGWGAKYLKKPLTGAKLAEVVIAHPLGRASVDLPDQAAGPVSLAALSNNEVIEHSCTNSPVATGELRRRFEGRSLQLRWSPYGSAGSF